MRRIFILLISIACSGLTYSSNGYNALFSPGKPLVTNQPNHAPTGADKTITILEDIPRVFAAADFGFNDPNDEPQHNLMAVKITTLPANGLLKMSGVNVVVNQFIHISNITFGNFTFTPTLNTNGTPYTTFTFQVQDDGGIANGGIDLDPTPNTITFNVTAVNDAPVFLIGASQAICRNSSAQTISNWCTGISDGDPDLVQILGFVVTNDNNALFSVQPAVSVTGQLTYTPALNATGVANVSVRLTDNGGTANGGVNTSAIQMAKITLKPDGGWIATGTTNWFTSSNWCSNSVPTATTNVIIYPGTAQPLISTANATCSHITMMPTSTLNIAAPRMLTVTGN